MKHYAILTAAAVLALAGGIISQTRSNPFEQADATSAALNFTLPDLQDTPRSIDEWKGKILVINFWATWCPPCLKEIPEFVQLQQELADRNVQFIGIAIEDKSPVAAFIKRQPMNYPVLIAGDNGIALSQQLGNVIGAVPFTLIVNSQGQVIHRHPGELTREKMLELLKPLL